MSLKTWIKNDLEHNGIEASVCQNASNAHVITFNNQEDLNLYKLVGDRLFKQDNYYYFYRIKKTVCN